MVIIAAALFQAQGAVLPETVRYEPHRNMSESTRREVQQLLARVNTTPPNNAISDLIHLVSPDWVLEHAEQLSGETGSQLTRVTNSEGPNAINAAVAYVQEKMTGYGFTVSLKPYRDNWGPNVVSVLPGTTRPNELVIVGAHLDDIPASGRAPGANDDGSGSSALLAMARAIHESRVRFESTLIFEHYTGEEQGLVGSRALAKERSERGDNVIAQLQSDMTALRLDGDPLAVAFVQDARAVNLDLTRTAIAIAEQYKDSELTVLHQTASGSSCCSDHQSYFEYGFPSAGYIEMRGYTGDPQYHKVGDVVRRAEYSLLQIALAARVTLAAAATIAVLDD